MSVRVRFAPSPTGYPHIGNIRTALFNWLWARHNNGQFILRIEDTDRERYNPDALESIIEGLRWIGLDWDEGPGAGTGETTKDTEIGDYGPYFQSERLDIYHKYVEKLVDEGNAYWCNCTKERLDEMREYQKANKLPPGYDGTCRDKGIKSSPDDPNTVLRFRIPEDQKVVFNDFLRGEITFETNTLDDFVLLKSDGFPTYHFAVVVDDYLMKITHIMRAEEWIPSAGKHVLLYRALGFPMPELVHLPMILGDDRTKLSKRHGATSILEYRDMGFLPEAVFNFIALMGWAPGDNKEVITEEEMVSLFDIARINKAPAVFDQEKLKWMNGEYIRMMSPEKIHEILKPLYDAKGWECSEEYGLKIATAMQERLKLANDIYDLGAFFFEDVTEYQEKGVKKHFKPEAVQRLTELFEAFRDLDDWSEEGIEGALRALAEKNELKPAKYIHPMRLATSGLTFGPSAFALIEILGKEKVLERLVKAWEYVEKIHAE